MSSFGFSLCIPFLGISYILCPFLFSRAVFEKESIEKTVYCLNLYSSQFSSLAFSNYCPCIQNLSSWFYQGCFLVLCHWLAKRKKMREIYILVVICSEPGKIDAFYSWVCLVRGIQKIINSLIVVIQIFINIAKMLKHNIIFIKL